MKKTFMSLFFKYSLIIFVILLSPNDRVLVHADINNLKIVKMWETCEWTVKNTSWSGNPFDLIASVKFVSQSNNEVCETKMYYNGGDEWKFRFTGTRMGLWTFETSSSDSDMNLLSGSVLVEKNPDKNIKGFLTHKGNQYAIWAGNEPELQPYRFMVYMNEKKYRNFDSKLSKKAWTKSPMLQFRDDSILNKYLNDASDNGFDIIYFHPGFPDVWTDGVNPRFETFEILEKAIKMAHGRGMRVHIWMWGDDARKATPKGLGRKGKIYKWLHRLLPGRLVIGKFGINGKEDRRLQRYIAARLGPLPGWSMGYGFDLHEWTNESNLNEWASFLHEEFGWDHLLAARGYRLLGSNNINSYDGFGRNVPLKTTRHGPKDYQEILEDLNGDKSKPHLYAERHSYKREYFDLDMDGTRRLIWRQIMAGGMGGWYGFYTFSDYPYPDPEQLRCAREFFKKNYQMGLAPVYPLPGGYCLRSSDNARYIFYVENADSIEINTSAMKDIDRVVMIDCKKRYEEIALKILYPEELNNLPFPYLSDWVLLVTIK